MKALFFAVLFAVLCSGCVSHVDTATSDFSSVNIYCVQYNPNPGSLKGEVRLNNGTGKRIKAKVARGTNPPQEYTIEAGKSVLLSYLVFGELPCNHKFRIVSWE
jgi:hypothetical protein